MSVSKPNMSSDHINTHRALLGVPLAVIIIFSFGFVMMQHEAPSTTHVIDNSSTTGSKPKASKLQTTKQTSLPTVTVEAGNSAATSSSNPPTSSPQTPSIAPTQNSAPNPLPPSDRSKAQGILDNTVWPPRIDVDDTIKDLGL